MAFVDLTKAFDTVNRDLLWNFLRKLGCPPTSIAILQQFHTGIRHDWITVLQLSC